jgi:GYF domain 2/PilZ domain
MQKYFVAHEGIQTGPWTLDEVSLKLSQKNIDWNDYIYDDKTEDWVLLLEFPALTALFNKSFKNPIKDAKTPVATDDPLRDRAWYILKQNNNYGPFSKAEMIQMLQSKTLFEFDFIWKQGLASWKRLSEVGDFQPEEVRKVYEVSDAAEGEIFFRRRHARSEYGCSLILHDQKKIFKGRSFEISAGGAGIIIEDVNFELEQQLYLHFTPGGQVPAFNAICRVVSRSGNKYGLRFVTVAASVKDSITKYTKKAA